MTKQRAPASPPPSTARFGKRALVALCGVAVAGSVTAGVLLYNRAGRNLAFPAPGPRPPDVLVTGDDFLGAEACSSCHPAQYALWKGSTHGHAGSGPPRAPLVKGPFDGRPIRFRDAVVTPSVTGSGKFVFTVAQQGRAPVVFQVDAVVGGGYMEGGGTQAAFSRFPDGTLRFLPFDYSPVERAWFCQLRPSNRGWVPITTALSLADCDAWPPTRILGSSERFQTCQQCHGSQIEVAFDSSAQRYATRFTTLAINCESCHGPGRRHVELARSGKINGAADIGMRSLSTLTKDRSLEVCFQCHAVKTALQPGYLPGERLEDHFALKLPLLLDTIYHADGRTRVFAYQEGHLSSDCYVNGSMSCVDCHDPHNQQYRDINGAPLAGRFDDGQCLDCHASKRDSTERHTRHKAGSAGSRCVACHMPYLQEPSVGPRVRYSRSDHTIPIPRPVEDARMGIENACQTCHRDRTPQALQAQVSAWYGEIKPHPPAVARVFAADSAGDATSAARRALSGSDGPAMPEFAALARAMGRYASSDLGALDGESIDRLETLAQGADPDVQALALATLHFAKGADPRVRRFLARQLRRLGARESQVRDRWAWILRVRGDARLASGDYDGAIRVYRMGQEVTPGDPTLSRSLGVAYTRLRDYPRAIEHFRRSLALRPKDPQVLVELGFATMQRGTLDSAIAAYRQAIAINPWESGAYANLGIAYLRAATVGPAVQALQRAVELDPGLSAAHFALASAYAQLGERARAIAAVERGLEFDPGNTSARRMLDALHGP